MTLRHGLENKGTVSAFQHVFDATFAHVKGTPGPTDWSACWAIWVTSDLHTITAEQFRRDGDENQAREFELRSHERQMAATALMEYFAQKSKSQKRAEK